MGLQIFDFTGTLREDFLRYLFPSMIAAMVLFAVRDILK